MAIPLCSWRSRIFYKINPKMPRKRRQPHNFGDLTLTVRCCYDPTRTMKIRLGLNVPFLIPQRAHKVPFFYKVTVPFFVPGVNTLRLVYADGDVAATLLRPWRWSYFFVALLCPFYKKSEIPIRFYYELGPSTALLSFLLRFVSF